MELCNNWLWSVIQKSETRDIWINLMEEKFRLSDKNFYMMRFCGLVYERSGTT